MQDPEARLRRLEAESEIRRLKARYLNACDAKDPAALRACFTPDAEISLPPLADFDLDGLVESFEAQTVRTAVVVTHQGCNPEIEVLGEDEATARWQIVFTLHDPESGAFRRIVSFSDDRYRRTDGGWRIAATRAAPRMMLDGKLDGGAATVAWVPLEAGAEGLSLAPEG